MFPLELMIYPYVLGYHLAARQLCRIPIGGRIPSSCVKIIKYKSKQMKLYWINPYTELGELRPEYWSLRRDQDIEFYISQGLITINEQ